jgi:hypothetical protein
MKKNQKEISAKDKQSIITRVAVAGYKSISSECAIDIKPLTVLAGANSSGKSSIIQPLLLLKQTLEANYDPGALKLTGPNVRFSSGEQLLCKCSASEKAKDLQLTFSTDNGTTHTRYHWQKQKGFEIVDQSFKDSETSFILIPGMDTAGLHLALPSEVKKFLEPFGNKSAAGYKLKVVRDRSFLDVQVQAPEAENFLFGVSPAGHIKNAVRRIIHLPGLRGNPERNYPVTAVGNTFQGTFQEYTASVIAKWQIDGEKEKLKLIGKDLEKLGLTWKVVAVPQNDTQVELQVGRMPHPAHGGAYDLVSIADVGLGVSQTLPVVVALHVARPGQMVFLEQPEIHLHPRAQMALAEVLAEAANREVVVIVETHSSILLRGIQTAVAQRDLSSDKVSLNWFKRDLQSGLTECTAGTLDGAGAFGDWPEDFDEITLESEKRFMDANETALN